MTSGNTDALRGILIYHSNRFNDIFPYLTLEDITRQAHHYVMHHITLENPHDLLMYVKNVRFMIKFTQAFVEHVIGDQVYLDAIYLYCARNLVSEYIEMNYPYKMVK
jgi:hypothetical protein